MDEKRQMPELIQSVIEFKRNGEPHKWTVWHNLHTHKTDIMSAFENWCSRFEQFTVEDFCDYVVSKDPRNFKCIPE